MAADSHEARFYLLDEKIHKKIYKMVVGKGDNLTVEERENIVWIFA